MGFAVLNRIPIYQMPSPPRSREQSPIRSQPPASPRATRKALSQLPQAPNRKHYLSGLSEPEAKRPTLAQKAGDFSNKNPAAPASNQPLNHAVTTTATAGPFRFTASTSTRPSPPRGKSITSFSASVGPSVRSLNTTTSTLPRPAMASGRIPRQTRPAMNTTTIGLHNTTQRASIMRAYTAATPSGSSNARIDASTINRDGSGQAPIVTGKPIFPSFSALAIAAPLEHRNTQDIPSIGTRATLFRSKLIPVSSLPECISGRRDLSVTPSMRGLSLESSSSSDPSIREGSPTKLPRPVTPALVLPSTPWSIPKSRQKYPPKLKRFLTRDSNTTAWDPDEVMASMEKLMGESLGKFQQTAQESSSMKEMLNTYRNQYLESERNRAELSSANAGLCSTNAGLSSENQMLRVELRDIGDRLTATLTETALLKQEVENLHQVNDDLRSHFTTATTKATNLESTVKRLESENKSQSIQNAVLEQMHSAATNATETSEKLLRAQGVKEQALQAKIDALERDYKSESERYAATAKEKDAAIKEANEDKDRLFKDQIARTQALQAKVDFLESDSKSQSEHYAAMAREREAAISTADEATERLRKEETLRRHLHNIIQELKGNIRVFCRVRPAISPDGSPSKQAQLTFPDTDNATQIEVRGPDGKSSLGKDTTKVHPFAFDRVFSPKSTNQEVFDEVSQLIQSSLDGYNVCIFAYGQTGSGKTYTMSAEDGMIPKALHMIYNNTKDLEDRGWKYNMTGSFVEVYNESINDLLSKSNDKEKRKLEIKHDMQKSETTITNVTIVNLDSTEEVESILARAMDKRSVAATQANERSSRSHSVFMLNVIGENTITGEQSKGTLNLVDLAGSERLDQSKAEGARLKETQSINRSLSSLGDVIGALGQGKEGGHIPYRNSKLTNLLQFSLGGNSKTLMFCMVSPLRDHLAESLTTLRFAAKVNNTHIGRASKA